MGSQQQRDNLTIHKPWQGDKRFLDRVFKVDAFKKQYLARLAEFNQSIFKPERFHKQVDEVAALIRPSVKQESEEKLARFEKAVAGEAISPAGFGGPPGGGPPGFGGFASIKPIKAFVTARAPSVLDQVSGKSEGETIAAFGFGGPGGPGGGGRGQGRGGPGGPQNFGPGSFLGPPFMSALDSDKNSVLSKEEFTAGFDKWFRSWNSDGSGVLSEEQLREGINRDLATPPPGGRPGGPGFGPPQGP
jgi:hypothetical protein